MPSMTRSESVPSSGVAEGARALDVGTDAGVTFTDLGQLVLWIVQLVEHREMPFWWCGWLIGGWWWETKWGASEQALRMTSGCSSRQRSSWQRDEAPRASTMESVRM
jgi:hypothetical protein